MSRRTLCALCLLLPTSAALAQEKLACPQFEFGGAAAPAAEPERLVITADQAELTQGGLSTLEGTVRLKLGDNEFEAQSLSYDEAERRVRIQQDSLFRGRDLIIRSQSAEFDLDDEGGVFHGNEFTLVKRSARGAAELIEVNRNGTARIEDVYYTTCAPGSRDWFLEASEIELDQPEGLGTARHARLRFGYVPILYAPWFQFPIDDRRRTGFLFPTVGDSDNTGFDFRIPFYLNLAPNYDAELTPRYMATRGTQMNTEGRYLLPAHTGRVAWEYLDEDEQRRVERSFVDFQHDGLINRRLSLDARYGEVSDQNYFEELGGRLDAASVTHLERSARLVYAAPAVYSISARVTDYQTVAQNVLFEPHRREPELRIQALTPKAWLDTLAGFDGEYVNFVHDAPGVDQGQRTDLNPYLRFQRDANAWYAGARLDGRYTQYRVDPQPGGAVGPSRALPVFSAESGLRFDRLTQGGELQTLEPRLFYLYVPYRDQDSLPIFDTGEPDFDFLQLFALNRYSGTDRISDANHLTTAFTSRLINPETGDTRLSFSLGQIYRFTEPRLLVTKNGIVQPGFATTSPGRGGTDYVAELDYRLAGPLRLISASQWSPDTGEFVRNSAGVRWRGERVRGDLSYRYRTDVVTSSGTVENLEQTDASAVLPIWGGLSTMGRLRYSLPDSRSLEALGGVEYKTCCWAARGAYRRYQYSFDDVTFEPRYSNGIYLQLELTGLTRIGAGFQALLPTLE